MLVPGNCISELDGLFLVREGCCDEVPPAAGTADTDFLTEIEESEGWVLLRL